MAGRLINRPGVEGKYLVNFQGMLLNSGSILRGAHFWEVLFTRMLSPGWQSAILSGISRTFLGAGVLLEVLRVHDP